MSFPRFVRWISTKLSLDTDSNERTLRPPRYKRVPAARNPPSLSSAVFAMASATDRVLLEVQAACDEVFGVLDVGLPENVYVNALIAECEARGLPCDKEIQIPVCYKGRTVGHVRGDILVGDRDRPEERVIVEVKAVTNDITGGSHTCRQYKHQVTQYRNLLGVGHGLLVNFPSNGEVATPQTFLVGVNDPDARKRQKRKRSDEENDDAETADAPKKKADKAKAKSK